jgi:SpoU rRNA methylase family enzyme
VPAGNQMQSILRAGKKDLLVQDLKKAIECLNREIDYEAGK